MSDYDNYVRGSKKAVTTKAIVEATVIEQGDLLSITAGVPDPADDFTWDTDLATTQAAFVALFAGVALEASADGDTDTLLMARAGIFKFTCASATFELGALVGPAKATGNALENQKVVAVADEKLAIGRVAKREGSAVTEVQVEVMSTVLRGLYEIDT